MCHTLPLKTCKICIKIQTHAAQLRGGVVVDNDVHEKEGSPGIGEHGLRITGDVTRLSLRLSKACSSKEASVSSPVGSKASGDVASNDAWSVGHHPSSPYNL